ncbi:flavin reductase family protein [Ideonella azotifigens]|nr:flavin reductase family protein [Ideonella azotifigens]MCD2340782.1 flavin reductase family protein [Ideonella azotifigens]
MHSIVLPNPPPRVPSSVEVCPSILYFGTPVALISTLNLEGAANLSPMSSVWALADRLVLGLAQASQGCENFVRSGEAVINLPGPDQCVAVEALAPTTGRFPVPGHKRDMGYRHEGDKFALAKFTPLASRFVGPPRIAECPLQLEVRLLAAHGASVVDGADPGFLLLEAKVLQVHAHQDIVLPGSQHIDTQQWSPLLYVFRHYFATGGRLGRNFRAET